MERLTAAAGEEEAGRGEKNSKGLEMGKEIKEGKKFGEKITFDSTKS